MTGGQADRRRRIFAANWKMHNGPAAAREWVGAFLAAYPPHDDREVIVAPGAVAIEAVATALAGRDDVRAGVQNIADQPKGAFTGETAAGMARDAGAHYALVGHSERRHVYGESDATSAAKCAMALDAGLAPVFCVGETLAQREQGETAGAVLRQLDACLLRIGEAAVGSLVVAYEPVWAIGTGRTATPDDAAEVHAVIRARLLDVGGPAARGVPILYGGSVNAGNAASLLAAPDVSGLLVGGASLDPLGWAAICRT